MQAQGQPRRSVIARIAAGVAMFAVIALCATSVFGDGGLLEIERMRGQDAQLRAKADALESDNAKLKDQIRKLQEDDATIERVAREQQGLVKDGETLYRFPSR